MKNKEEAKDRNRLELALDHKTSQLIAYMAYNWEVATSRMEQIVTEREQGRYDDDGTEAMAVFSRLQHVLSTLFAVNGRPQAALLKSYRELLEQMAADDRMNRCITDMMTVNTQELSIQAPTIWKRLSDMLPKAKESGQNGSAEVRELYQKNYLPNMDANDALQTMQVLVNEEEPDEQQQKDRDELFDVPGGLFAKWTTDRKAFETDFLDVQLSDDVLRHFIFHLASLAEIARELDPTTKFGNEQLVRNEPQKVGDAVLEAAHKLDNLVAETWFPHYDAMWQELIADETIFARLTVTRKSPHNNLFTVRFFCHLVGEMKKRAVFGNHSDNNLAENLTEKRYAGTYRKNIQEGMGDESADLQKIFNTIYQKYNALAHSKK